MAEFERYTVPYCGNDPKYRGCRMLRRGASLCNAIQRLSFYEDTGLSPVDVAELVAENERLKDERDQAVKKLCEYCKAIIFEYGKRADDCCSECKYRGVKEDGLRTKQTSVANIPALVFLIPSA